MADDDESLSVGERRDGKRREESPIWLPQFFLHSGQGETSSVRGSRLLCRYRFLLYFSYVEIAIRLRSFFLIMLCILMEAPLKNIGDCVYYWC